ncbi:HNH endonuclease [Paraburkholderia sp. Tr-20389]|nr:HNH endonuclease signature motif containing protein [Paraburkholderia sp. Tr-20389]MBN3756058.1 HNH endonuclease [Paraburkholderia sp. Tr-20389]
MSLPTPRTVGSRWRAIRARQLRHHPLCAECLRLGHITEATEVDHILRLEEGGTDADANLQSLCHDCHARKTAKENGARPRGCDANGMPIDPEHPWSR